MAQLTQGFLSPSLKSQLPETAEYEAFKNLTVLVQFASLKSQLPETAENEAFENLTVLVQFVLIMYGLDFLPSWGPAPPGDLPPWPLRS